MIRLITLQAFHKETMREGSYLNGLQRKLLGLHKTNEWSEIFDKTTINARNGLRLPFSDKASRVISADDKARIAAGEISQTKAFKKLVKEGRPSKAIGVIEFEWEVDVETDTDKFKSSRWIHDDQSLDRTKYLEKGTCRRDANNYPPLTEYSINQDVLTLLKKAKKSGEEFTADLDGNYSTHKPFDNILKVDREGLEVSKFVQDFNEALEVEQEVLESRQSDVLEDVKGTWVCKTARQGIWRSCAASQTGFDVDEKVPDKNWNVKKLRRPTEVVYLRSKGKVIINGSRDAVATMRYVLKDMTTRDDNHVVSKLDRAAMERE
eukprot:TRINITY_DN30384_c0_g1_i3.p1 TRINITY_DN30384_c0_g1~~TRINITY_DN30384_c0_g1_i3.p1  ORF type:complete len:321 (-),score=73.67 TRINITY_DN30384_c0_g1_i3:510-1472(-)